MILELQQNSANFLTAPCIYGSDKLLHLYLYLHIQIDTYVCVHITYAPTDKEPMYKTIIFGLCPLIILYSNHDPNRKKCL